MSLWQRIAGWFGRATPAAIPGTLRVDRCRFGVTLNPPSGEVAEISNHRATLEQGLNFALSGSWINHEFAHELEYYAAS